jgi:hypothetical protein
MVIAAERSAGTEPGLQANWRFVSQNRISRRLARGVHSVAPGCQQDGKHGGPAFIGIVRLRFSMAFFMALHDYHEILIDLVAFVVLLSIYRSVPRSLGQD